MTKLALKAGLAYFAIVLVAGFILGALRVLVLAPIFGETLAVVIEGPFILAASWIVCRYLIARLSVAARLEPRVTMGASAFSLLLLAEAIISVLVLERTLSVHLEIYQTTHGVIGLAGQTLFALFPAIQLRIGRSRRR